MVPLIMGNPIYHSVSTASVLGRIFLAEVKEGLRGSTSCCWASCSDPAYAPSGSAAHYKPA